MIEELLIVSVLIVKVTHNHEDSPIQRIVGRSPYDSERVRDMKVEECHWMDDPGDGTPSSC